MDSNDEPKWWFPRKEFGWGWGLPCTWQGWTAFLGFLFLLVAGGPLASSAFGQFAGLLLASGLTIAFVVLVVMKGEPLSGERHDWQHIRRNPATLLRHYKISSCLLSAVVILVSIPLALKWVSKNALYGFRVPSSLAGSSAHWFYVNQVAGVAGIVAGVLSLVFALLVANRLKMSEVATGRAVLIVTVVLILTAMIPPFLAR